MQQWINLPSEEFFSQVKLDFVLLYIADWLCLFDQIVLIDITYSDARLADAQIVNKIRMYSRLQDTILVSLFISFSSSQICRLSQTRFFDRKRIVNFHRYADRLNDDHNNIGNDIEQTDDRSEVRNGKFS